MCLLASHHPYMVYENNKISELTKGCACDFVVDGAVVEAVLVGVVVTGGRLVTGGFTSAGSDFGVTSLDMSCQFLLQKKK